MLRLKYSNQSKELTLNDMGVAKMKLDKSTAFHCVGVLFLMYNHYRAFLSLSSSQSKLCKNGR